LEARINELMTAITDETVRRYYRQEFWQRLRALAAAGSPDRPARRGFQAGAAGRKGRNGTVRAPSQPHGGGRGPETPLAPLSPQLQNSAIVRGWHNALPPREALIILATFNHPWLLETEAEQLADLEFLNSEADMLRRVVLDITSSGQSGQVPDSAA